MRKETLLAPRIGFAAFSLAVGLMFPVIAGIVSISNGEGKSYLFYLGQYLFAVPVIPMLCLMFLNASCRITAEGDHIFKHDFVVTTRIPIAAIKEFDGDNGIDILLRNSRRLEYWGYGSSLLGELFSLQGPYRCAYRLNCWLEAQELYMSPLATSSQQLHENRIKRTIRTDIFNIFLVVVCVTLIGSVVAWYFADDLRPAINSPEFTSWLE